MAVDPEGRQRYRSGCGPHARSVRTGFRHPGAPTAGGPSSAHNGAHNRELVRFPNSTLVAAGRCGSVGSIAGQQVRGFGPRAGKGSIRPRWGRDRRGNQRAGSLGPCLSRSAAADTRWVHYRSTPEPARSARKCIDSDANCPLGPEHPVMPPIGHAGSADSSPSKE